MFWKKPKIESLSLSVAEVSESEQEIAPPSRRPEPIAIDAGFDDEYMSVALALGMDSTPAIASEKLRRLLRDENIHVFDRKAVYDYLDKILGQWSWMALRESDYKSFDSGRWRWQEKSIRNGPYPKAIPLPVLLTVKNLSEKMQGISFFVSATEKDLDPFLMVTTGGRGDCYIIERWDEPGFRE